MPTPPDVALTQLSFLEFVQRCNVLAAPSQSIQLPASVSLVDVAVQTAAPCEVSQDSSTQTSDQPGSSLSLDVAVQTTSRSTSSSFLDATVQTPSYSSLSQDVSTQFGSRTVSSFSVDAALQTAAHIALCNLTLPHNSTSLSSSLAGFSQTVLLVVGILFVSPRHQCWAHMWYLFRRLDLNNQPLPP